MFGIPAKSFSDAPNVDLKGQYFIIDVNSRNHVVIANNTLQLRGAVVEWLEQLGYGGESRRIA